MRNEELNTGLGLENSCEVCGKRLPARNNQVSFACRRERLCRECYENTYLVCERCGGDLPKGRGLKNLTARAMGCCLDCYEEEVGINEPSDSPWEWNESIRMMYDEIDHYER
ncbi:MAG: hypothetical protein V1709_02600 [Planctomycetota bacterium]